MKLTARYAVLIATVVIVTLCSASCAPGTSAALASTQQPTSTITATPIVTPTPKPTITPSPAPTATPLFSEERTAELNQQIYDFNHNEGGFTNENKSKMAIYPEMLEDLDSVKLGLATSDFYIEGYFFDYFEKDESLILIMGFDGRNGSSFTTLVEIPLYFLMGEPKATFVSHAYEKNTVLSSMRAIQYASGVDSRDALYDGLDKLISKVIMVKPSFESFPGSEDDHTGITKEYFKKHENKVGLSGKLLSSVATNEIEIENSSFCESDYEVYSLIKLNNLDDVANIDVSEIPMMHLRVAYFEG